MPVVDKGPNRQWYARFDARTAWTTLHLAKEKAVAEIVDIPYERVQQVCLTPLAFTKGTDFKAAIRPDPDTVIDWR